MALRPRTKGNKEAAPKEAGFEERKVHQEALLAEAAETKNKVIAETSDAERELLAISSQIEKLEVEAVEAGEKRDKAVADCIAVEKDLSSLKAEKSRAESELAKIKEAIDTESKKHSDANSAFIESYSRRESECTKQLNSLHAQIIEKTSELEIRKKAIDDSESLQIIIDGEIEEKRKVLSSLNEDISSSKKSLEELKPQSEKLASLRSEVGQKEAELERFNILIKEAKENHAAVLESTKKREEELVEKARINAMVESTIDQKSAKLKQMLERAEVAGIIKDKII